VKVQNVASSDHHDAVSRLVIVMVWQVPDHAAIHQHSGEEEKNANRAVSDW
jgi:hypothetical protein